MSRGVSVYRKLLVPLALFVVAIGAAVSTAWGEGRPSWVTVSVPGAMNVSAYCGGETRFADGEQISFSPEHETCELEAPLSPVMPLRGQLTLSRATAYVCDRKGMDLECRPAE
jgi:hypothetical protein